ncbi:peptidase, partial [Pseudomonas frederiksbergensis]|nr:peptidase [Pseudomonas frederiksbergensis]
ILIEQHAFHPYQTQVLGIYVMLKSMFQVIGDQAVSLNEAIRQDRERLETQEQVSLTLKPGKAQTTAFTVGDYRYEPSPVTGARTIVWS